MKYLINSYDSDKDIATVTLNFKYKTVQQDPVIVRAHNVPVESKNKMDAWALGYVQALKKALRESDDRKANVIDPLIVAEQTVNDN